MGRFYDRSHHHGCMTYQFSRQQCLRIHFQATVPAYSSPGKSACVFSSRSQYLRTLILVFVCCKTRLVTFVLRGCDSISLVPYVPGPILATICRSESQLTS